jgi:uncharacterized Tic20 family protein
MDDASELLTGPSEEARKWGMIVHLSALVGLLGNGIGFLLGPLAVWLMKREEDPFIDANGKEAVNFQITMMIAAVVSGFLILILVGFVLLFIVAIMAIVFPILAGLKAKEGEVYRYPMTIRFIK